jgi:Ca2+-transporting ATPase
MQIANPHSLSIEKTANVLQTDIIHGLSVSEAELRLKETGPNILEPQREKGQVLIFFSQFKSLIVYLLFITSIVSFMFGDYTEGGAILIVIFINAIIGFALERQAVKSMKALKKLDVITSKVWRDGVLIEISSEEIVPGDIISIESGDVIPADARLFSISQLEVNESTLTGESLPVIKITDELVENTVVADRRNMIYKGTAVSKGNGKAMITATGQKTELGKISSMVNRAKKDENPFNIKLNSFSKKLIVFTILLIIPFVFIGLLEGREFRLIIKTAMALAVAAIPEGLPIVATIALAHGMLKLSRYKVIVKKLVAVETLGSTNVIFTDKTGTLTENRLEASTICIPATELEIIWNEENESIRLQQLLNKSRPESHIENNLSLHDNYHDKSAISSLKKETETDIIDENNNENLNWIFSIASLCNNATYSKDTDTIIGDPLEAALLKLCEYNKAGFVKAMQISYPRIYELPFDSAIKMMATLHENKQRKFAAVKGAVEEILVHSTHILENGIVYSFSENKKKHWLSQTDQLAKKGLRVLAFAYKDTHLSQDRFVNNLIFIGLVGFLDPPRKDVPQAVRECLEAGIRVVMVTGDHTETARSIALKIGLTNDQNEKVIHGKAFKPLGHLTKDEENIICDAIIFSRVSPSQKLDLIALYQKKKFIVAMTGDGVNDAPALKNADIGIAMGKRGTQVAREAADMVLQDDSFASITKAIKYGRVVYSNIHTFIIYLLSCNLSEILVVAFAAFLNLSLPLQALQILFLNIVTDVFPALALGMGEGNPSVMLKPPRNPNDSIINRKNWISIFIYSMAITFSVLTVFVYGHLYKGYSASLSNNIAFFSLAFTQLLHPLNLIPSSENFFRNDIMRNPHLWIAVVFCITIIITSYFLPYTREVLNIQVLGSEECVLIFAGSIMPLIIIQILKRSKLIWD